MTTNTVAGVALPASALRPAHTGRPSGRARPRRRCYPLIPDESRYFPAADFDKATWLEDALAFVETCRRFDLPVAIGFALAHLGRMLCGSRLARGWL